LKTILVLGGSGLVGHAIIVGFKNLNYYVVSVTQKSEVASADESIKVDLTKRQRFNDLPQLSKFDLVVNTIAITNVRKCNDLIQESFDLHVLLSRYLASNSKKYVYISSVAVYGDYSDEFSQRRTSLNNWYSKTKFFGEPGNNHLTLRINVIGLGSITNRSLLEWAYDELTKSKTITGFSNHFINPVLPEHVFEICNRYINGKTSSGCYDVGSKDILSKYDILDVLAKSIGKTQFLKQFKTDGTNYYQIATSPNMLIFDLNLNEYINEYMGKANS
jgi:dTDP-4-dehydrorhamnose reductase